MMVTHTPALSCSFRIRKEPLFFQSTYKRRGKLQVTIHTSLGPFSFLQSIGEFPKIGDPNIVP